MSTSRRSHDPENSRASAIDGTQGLINGVGTSVRPSTPLRESTPAATEIVGQLNGVSLIRNTQSIEEGLSAAPRRRSKTPGRYASPPKRALYDPRASPPQAATEAESPQDTLERSMGQEQVYSLAEGRESLVGAELINPRSNERAAYELPSTTRLLGIGMSPERERDEDGEPRLPSTPTQLGLEPPPEPPNGLLLSSPRRRPKRRIRTSAKESPLKSRIPATSETVVDSQKESSLGPRTYYSRIQRPLTNSEAATSHRTDQHVQPSSLTQRLSLFLPFSKRPAPPIPRPPTPPLDVLDALPDVPHSMLNTITAAEQNVKSDNSDDPDLRRKEITFTSPQKLLVTKVQVTVNLSTKKITDISLSSISPWAAPELGTWLRKSMVNMDLVAVRYAISEYWNLSEIRAQSWLGCEQEFGDLLGVPSPSDPYEVSKSRAPSDNRPKGRRKLPNPITPSNLSPSASPTPPPLPFSTSRSSLRYYLGRSSLLFTQAPISLLISWRIVFDAAGKLESHVSAHSAFPEAWVEAEWGKELGRVGEAFDGLLRRDLGVEGAVRTVCAILFGAEGRDKG